VETGKLLRYTETHDFVSGDFMWTGIDYLGECSWPDRAASFGCLDTAGFPKDMFYFYKSAWNRKEPFAYLCPHWNLDVQEGTVVPVLCYTTCHEAELFVNGVSYGRKAKLFPDYGMTMEYGHFDTVRGFPTTDDLFLSWDVPYQPGTLEAAGFEEGREVCRCRVVTAGSPASLSLLADRKELLADGRDIVQVELSLLDASGNPVPDADLPVEIRVSGEGELLGADSGRPDSHIPWKSTHQETFGGKLLVILRAGTKNGVLSLAVQAGDLSAEVSIPVVDG
jgi:beta-galactosidase